MGAIGENTEAGWNLARDSYAELGVDAEAALEALARHPLALPCWQGDDLGGLEGGADLSGSGLQVTGAYPGRPRGGDELRADLEAALGWVPGRHRVNVHAMYAETGGKVDRDALGPEHFARWADWAAALGIGLDFNATCFGHPRAASGFTLAARDAPTRSFWVEHVRRCRAIGAALGRRLGSPCLHNLWIPDGTKDVTVDRMGRRTLLRESLDEIYARHHPPAELEDAVESKLFGVGVESFTVGSHEFYLAYALSRSLMLCLDLGHFHPTESIADKLSALVEFLPGLLLHVSRGVRWDSDHVVLLDDPLRETAAEVVRCNAKGTIRIALDFFDGGLSRVGALALSARAVQKALLLALLEPRARLLDLEASGDRFGQLALLERMKLLPAGAVWERFCSLHGAPGDRELPERVAAYEKSLAGRG